jgi:uncharacterized membrane protein YqjE
MATDVKDQNGASVTSLVSGIVEDAQDLLKQQFELFKHELRADVRKVKEGTLLLGVAGGIALVGSLLIGITASLLLQEIFPSLHLWVAFAIVSAAFLLGGGILCAAGLAKFNSIDPLQDETAETLKENVQWITKPK